MGKCSKGLYLKEKKQDHMAIQDIKKRWLPQEEDVTRQQENQEDSIKSLNITCIIGSDHVKQRSQNNAESDMS